MKVRLSDISPKGLKLNDTLSLENLEARVSDGRGGEIKYTTAPKVTLQVLGTPGDGAQAEGKIEVKFKQPCSTCLDAIEREMEIEFKYVLKPKPENPLADADLIDEEFEDGVGIAYYEGESIDLEELLQEQIILAIDLYWHPPRDKEDKCTVCGKGSCKSSTFGEASSTKLGDLLKAAISKN